MPGFNLFHAKDSIHTYRAGEIIFSQGDAGHFMYDVVDGEVALSKNGRQLVSLKNGEIFGETGLINNESHSVTATAVVDTDVAKISKRQFQFMVSETPNFAMRVMAVLAERLSKETAKHHS